MLANVKLRTVFLLGALCSVSGGDYIRATTPGVESRFDACDLSFLIPPSERSIRVSGNGNQNPILSKRLFEMFGDFIKQGHPDIEDPYSKLVITGFRFDPCGPVYPNDWDIKKCVLPNVRLIAQVYDKGKATTAALHMVFTLGVRVDQDRTGIQLGIGFDPDVRRKAIGELLQMKAHNAAHGIVTDGVPVGIHPAFSANQRDSVRTREFETEFEQFVRRFAVENAYFTTAVMFTQEPSVLPGGELDGKERWVWQKANVVRRNPQTGQPLAEPTLIFGGIPGFDPKCSCQRR